MKVLCESCGSLAEARLLARPDGAVVTCTACEAETAVKADLPAAPSAPLPAGEETAWSELRGRWGDDAAHQAFLSRFSDLEGLARAGARYREVLAATPSDGAALRARDEILKRASVLGLAELPRTSMSPALPRTVKWWAVALLSGALVGGAAWLAYVLASLGTVR